MKKTQSLRVGGPRPGEKRLVTLEELRCVTGGEVASPGNGVGNDTVPPDKPPN